MSNLKKYPKVLIISSVGLNSKTATGITLKNLFLGWPKENIYQIYDDNSEPDASLCGSYMRFGSSDIPIVHIFKKAIQNLSIFKSKNEVKKRPAETVTNSTTVTIGLMGSLGDIAPFDLPRSIVDWVTEFKPDVIYSVLGSNRMMSLVLKLNNLCSAPIVPHFMDDWPSTIYSCSWKFAIHRKILNSKIRDVLDKSPFRMAICVDMANEYTHRYGGAFLAFMNCVEISEQAPLFNESNTKIVRFGFVGGLHLNRWKSLRTVVETIQKSKDRGHPVTVDILAPEKDLIRYSSIFKCFSVIGEMKTIKASEVKKKINDYDVLLHVESFLDDDSLFTRLSVSTKIPQYMAASRPILAYGPGTLSSIRYVERTGSGLVVSEEQDRHNLDTVISQLILSPSLRSEVGQQGFLTAQKYHNAFKERIRFHETLFDASNKVKLS
jgi:hypothetical protein